jgi:hypothetical protein
MYFPNSTCLTLLLLEKSVLNLLLFWIVGLSNAIIELPSKFSSNGPTWPKKMPHGSLMTPSRSGFLTFLIFNLEDKVVSKGGGMIGFLRVLESFLCLVLTLGLVTKLISFYRLFSCKLRIFLIIRISIFSLISSL